MGVRICDLRLGNAFLDMTPNRLSAQEVIEQMDQQELIKIKDHHFVLQKIPSGE